MTLKCTLTIAAVIPLRDLCLLTWIKNSDLINEIWTTKGVNFIWEKLRHFHSITYITLEWSKSQISSRYFLVQSLQWLSFSHRQILKARLPGFSIYATAYLLNLLNHLALLPHCIWQYWTILNSLKMTYSQDQLHYLGDPVKDENAGRALWSRCIKEFQDSTCRDSPKSKGFWAQSAVWLQVTHTWAALTVPETIISKSLGACLGVSQRNQSGCVISFCSELVSLGLLNVKCRKAPELRHAFVHFPGKLLGSQRVQCTALTLALLALLMPLSSSLPLLYLCKVPFLPSEMPFPVSHLINLHSTILRGSAEAPLLLGGLSQIPEPLRAQYTLPFSG